MNGEWSEAYYHCSPLHFVPNLPPSWRLRALRQRFVVLASGEGQWEAPHESWHVANTLGARGIPNRVDMWGTGFDHDWVTWREMLPHYLQEV